MHLKGTMKRQLPLSCTLEINVLKSAEKSGFILPAVPYCYLILCLREVLNYE